MKRLDSKSQSFVSSTASSGVNTGSAAVAKDSVSPFEQMKATLRNNLKGLKKEEEKDPSELGAQSTAAQLTGDNMSSRRVSLIYSSLYISF